MIDYDSFSRCHLADIFFAFHAGAKELKLTIAKVNALRQSVWVTFFCVYHTFVYTNQKRFKTVAHVAQRQAPD